MQITIQFYCRECGRPDSRTWDPAGWVVNPNPKDEAGVVQLNCRYCGHTSGELKLDYIYRAEHRPSWEQYLPAESNSREIMRSATTALNRLKAVLVGDRLRVVSQRQAQGDAQRQPEPLPPGAIITWDWDADGGSGAWAMECQSCGLPPTPYPPRVDMTQSMVLEILERNRDQHNAERHPPYSREWARQHRK